MERERGRSEGKEGKEREARTGAANKSKEIWPDLKGKSERKNGGGQAGARDEKGSRERSRAGSRGAKRREEKAEKKEKPWEKEERKAEGKTKGGWEAGEKKGAKGEMEEEGASLPDSGRGRGELSGTLGSATWQMPVEAASC
jgi:hypothetical protein